MLQHRILAVDDDPLNRIILSELLEEEFHLELAESGEECLETASRFRPDLILLDIMMPGIDGYETCRLLRQDDALKNTKIVLVSAKAMTEERLEGYDAGADDYITKPFDGDELLAKVRVLTHLHTLEQMDELKSHFISLLAHETRTPLTGILGPAELLCMGGMDESEQLELSRAILQSARRLKNLIEKAEQIFALKAGAASLPSDEVQCDGLVESVLASRVEAARERGVDVVSQIERTGVIRGDAARLLGAVDAIVAHAIGRSPEGAKVQVSLSMSEGEVELSILDMGPQLSRDELGILFADFQVSEIEKHTGTLSLDLAWARQVIFSHGGWLWAESTEEAPLRVSVNLPKSEQGSPADNPVLQEAVR